MEKRRKNCKQGGGKFKMEGGEGEKSMKIHFLKPLKSFGLWPTKMLISTRKKHFMPGKKSWKVTLPPSNKYSSYVTTNDHASYVFATSKLWEGVC